jgi:hypothetical protein
VRLTRRRGNDGGAPDEGRDDDRNGRGGRSRARAGREVPTEVDVEEIDEPMVPTREFGPYDLSEAPPDERGLPTSVPAAPAVAGVEVHLSAGPTAGCSRSLAHEGSFRRSWALRRAAVGGHLGRGPASRCGTCCRTTAPRQRRSTASNGPELTAQGCRTDPLRWMFVAWTDGPRWFVHGVYMATRAPGSDPGRSAAGCPARAGGRPGQ